MLLAFKNYAKTEDEHGLVDVHDDKKGFAPPKAIELPILNMTQSSSENGPAPPVLS